MVAKELATKSREQDRLAIEARSRANEAAYDGFNRKLLNRWKVRPLISDLGNGDVLCTGAPNSLIPCHHEVLSVVHARTAPSVHAWCLLCV